MRQDVSPLKQRKIFHMKLCYLNFITAVIALQPCKLHDGAVRVVSAIRLP